MKRSRFIVVFLFSVFLFLIATEEARCTSHVESQPTSLEPEVLKKSTTLIVYYSRTGNTRAISESIKDTLGCDIQEIKDLKDRSGISGFIGGMIDVRENPTTDISPKEVRLENYNLLIIVHRKKGGTLQRGRRTDASENTQ